MHRLLNHEVKILRRKKSPLLTPSGGPAGWPREPHGALSTYLLPLPSQGGRPPPPRSPPRGLLSPGVTPKSPPVPGHPPLGHSGPLAPASSLLLCFSPWLPPGEGFDFLTLLLTCLSPLRSTDRAPAGGRVECVRGPEHCPARGRPVSAEWGRAGDGK